MPSQIFLPYVSRLKWLTVLKNGITNSGTYAALHYHLFKSNITPALSDTLSTYSAQEANYSGYSVKTLNTWTTPALSGTNVAFMVHDPLTFQQNGGGTTNTIYGGYWTNTDDDELLLVEKFSSSFSMADLGDVRTIVPRLTLAHITGGLIFLPYATRPKWLTVLKNGITNLGTYAGVDYHFFKSNITPALSDDLSDYSTEEADYSGYASESLQTWTTPALSDDDEAFMIHDSPSTFQHNGGGTSNDIYGGYWTNTDDDELLLVEKFSSDTPMAGLADIMTIVHRMMVEHAP